MPAIGYIFFITTITVFVVIPIIKTILFIQQQKYKRPIRESLVLEGGGHESGDANRQPQPVFRAGKNVKSKRKPKKEKVAFLVEKLVLIQKENGSQNKLLGNLISKNTEWIMPAAKIVIADEKLANKIFPITFKIVSAEAEIVYEKTIKPVLKLGENTVFCPSKLEMESAKKYFKEDLFWELGFILCGKLLAKTSVRLCVAKDKESFSNIPLTASDGELTEKAKMLINNISAPDLKDLLDKNLLDN